MRFTTLFATTFRRLANIRKLTGLRVLAAIILAGVFLYWAGGIAEMVFLFGLLLFAV